jgi:hypothetical protein
MYNIPKKAYFVFGEHKTNPMPDYGHANIRDFNIHNPDWKVEFVTLDDFNPEHADIFEWNKLAWSQVARYELIYKLGGLYSDIDIEYYSPLPDMHGCQLVVACEKHGSVSDAFFAASPGHPLLKECLDVSVNWCRRKMGMGVRSFTTEDLFNGCGVSLFKRLAKQVTGLSFSQEPQIHMTCDDFGGKFHPEKGVGILPFEALCRQNGANWLGWHKCVGTWRPKTEAGENDMRMEACLPANLNT